MYCKYCDDKLAQHDEIHCEFWSKVGYIRIAPLLNTFLFIENFSGKNSPLLKEVNDKEDKSYFIPKWFNTLRNFSYMELNQYKDAIIFLIQYKFTPTLNAVLNVLIQLKGLVALDEMLKFIKN